MTASESRVKRIPGCVSTVCRAHARHAECKFCRQACCETALIVEEGTLRRRRIPVCGGCEMRVLLNPESPVRWRQAELRELRSREDWAAATDEIDASAIEGGKLPEQIPSHVRRALRAFYESSEDTAVVLSELKPPALNASIRSLGLSAYLYAEIRSGQTVLRKRAAA